MKAVLAVIGIIVLVIAVIMLIFDGPDTPTQPNHRQINLTDYADTGARAVYEIEGEINAEELHRTIRISVDRNIRRVEVLNGYNKAVSKTQEFPNTQAAYDEFLHALKNAGYNHRKEAQATDEKGVCPLGQRYVYQIEEFGDDLIRLWSTSCGKKYGSFAGNASLVQRLFQKQIPEYREFVRDVKLYSS